MKNSIARHYNKIAEEYTKEHSYEENLSIPSLKEFLTYLPQNAKVLDVGCGGGQDSNFLRDNGCEVFGIDISVEMIKLAKEHFPGISFRVIDLIEFESNIGFDGIWCSRVFHNISISQQDKFIEKINSLLNKEGILYLTSVTSEKDIEEIKNGLNIKRLTEDSFKTLILKHSFKIQSFKYWAGLMGMDIIAKKRND